VPTGIAVEIPQGYTMLIFSRSGYGFRHQIRLTNCVGVIDSDYRGEILVSLHNDQVEEAIWPDGLISRYKAIAQALILPVPEVDWLESEELEETDRGTGGFGSTDTKEEKALWR
jgi:dUTP pyrophosphatase